MTKLNPNNIDINQKDWIEEVSDNWNDFLTEWVLQYKRGIITKEDMLKVAKKVAEHKKDNSLLEITKQRMGLKC